MSHNVKIKYYARENTKMKPHSYFAQAIPNGTYGFEELCAQAHKNTSIETHMIRASVEEYMKVAMEKLLDGFRVEIGHQFLTLGPALSAKVKDEIDANGNVTKTVTADDLTAVGARSRVTAVVNSEFSHEFNRSVHWQKSDRQGNPLEPDEEDATLDDDDQTSGGTQQPAGGTTNNTGGTQQNQNNNSGSGTSGSGTQTGGGTSGGGTQQQGQPGTYRLVTYKYGDGTATVTDQNGQTLGNDAQVASGTTINLSVVSVDNKRPCIRLDGVIKYIVNENNGAWTGSFQMPTKGTVLEILTDPDDDDFADEN